MSGFRMPSPVCENEATFHWEYCIDPLLSAAPTAITNGSYAGSARPPDVVPAFPAAATTVIPCRQATSAA